MWPSGPRLLLLSEAGWTLAAAAVMHSAPTYDPLRDHDPGCGLDHVPSYWAVTAGPAPDDDGPVQGDSEVDIVVTRPPTTEKDKA